MRTYSNSVAALIKKARAEKKVSQAKLNRLFSPDVRNGQFVSNIEQGKCQLPTRHIKVVLEFLDIPKEDLINSFMEDYKNSIVEVLNGNKDSALHPSSM